MNKIKTFYIVLPKILNSYQLYQTVIRLEISIRSRYGFKQC